MSLRRRHASSGTRRRRDGGHAVQGFVLWTKSWVWGDPLAPNQVISGAPGRREPVGEEADVLYGVTMQEQGVSRLLSLNLNEVEKELNIK